MNRTEKPDFWEKSGFYKPHRKTGFLGKNRIL